MKDKQIIQKDIFVSVVIPAYNEEGNIKATIENINIVFDGIINKYEIIVVDNNSTDKTKDIALKSGARVVFQQERSIAKTRNAGAKLALGKYLLFIDADTRINKKLISKSLLEIKKEKIIAVSSITKFDKYPSIGSYGIWFYNIISKLTKQGIGQFIFIEKTAFESISGFDEAYYAFEELDFFKRLKKKFGRSSFKVIFYPVKSSSRKLEKGKKDTNRFYLLLLAQLLGKEVGKDKSKLDYWYKDDHKPENNRYKIILLFILWFLFRSDNTFYLNNSPIRDWAFLTTPFIFALMIPIILDHKKDIKVFLQIVLITLIIEIIGVHTGLPFGDYEYSEKYALVGILGVPIFIGLAWYVILTTVSFITQNRLLTAIYIIFFDILLEIFAVKSGIWAWGENPFSLFGVPVLNYLSWGVIAFVLYPMVKKQTINRVYSVALITVLLGYIAYSLIIMGQPIGWIGYIFVLILMITGLRYSLKSL